MRRAPCILALLCLANAAWGAQAPSAPEHGMELREARIPMPDGVQLAADLWMPTGGAAGERFPVLLEYLPYRKNEDRGDRYGVYSYFVQRGYVVARVDIRGTGESAGALIPYEYSDREQEDGEAVISWLAAQDFSTGKVGMFGISWGGFNSIHMAMRNPPALKAIIAIEAADDLYEDDVHYIDGMMHADSYEFEMDIGNAVPGAPDFRIDEDYFRERFDTTPWFLVYKKQQRDGPFWDRTSPNAHFDSIRIPCFLIGGWYDGYRDSVPRMLEHVRAPMKAMIGPWSHEWPSTGFPDVPVEWRHEAMRWFDHWLKDRDTGIMEEPRLAVYVRDWHPPGTRIEHIPGRWRWEDGWPIARTRTQTLYPTEDHALAAKPSRASVHRLRYQATAGVEAGGPVMWYGDLGWDQRPVDAASLTYDTPVLADDVEILGFPRAHLETAVDAPLAYWFVRLSDVAPDGQVTLVAAAGFNAAQRESSASPSALESGRTYPIDVELHLTSWVFPKGHRIRVAVNNAQWPMIWPTPYAMTTSLRVGGAQGTRLELPVIPRGGPTAGPRFETPNTDPKLAGYGDYDSETPSGYPEIGIVERDYLTGSARAVAQNAGTMTYPWGSIRYTERIVHSASDVHPEATSVTSELTQTVRLPDRVLLFEGVLDFHSDLSNFYYRYTRRLSRNGELLRERSWEETIPRDFH